ncbi:hypothetical protein [Pseudomonas sp.]|uniref:hypothetical protein n=1 Tax=Pseudomonas sp. TaxID=306 RepID=UPI00299E38FA|nr:hypothetical protein [Pseudomonas sp.]MDX1366892.1 hypothetical protein [Pseudomonas sp.]
MQFTNFEVRRAIRIIFDNESEQLHADIHPDQDESLLDDHAFSVGNPAGLTVIHDHNAELAALVPEDHQLTEEHYCLGYFGGLEWTVIGISNKGEYQLQAGNCKTAIEEVCAALNALLPKI